MVATSADTVICLRSAISRRPSQNWSSSETLDLCPLRIIERLITGELAARCAGLRSVTGASEGTTVFDVFLDPDASARTIKSGQASTNRVGPWANARSWKAQFSSKTLGLAGVSPISARSCVLVGAVAGTPPELTEICKWGRPRPVGGGGGG